jgi:PAS domain S-box-containing protein
MVNKPLISIKNIFVIALIFVISFIIITLLLRNDSTLRMFFGDLSPIVIDLLVILTLFYATSRSKYYGRRVQMAWMFIALAFSFYTIGDILWAILELGFNQNPFPSIADGFYLIFYPLFAIGIYYLSKFSFSRSEMLKIFIDMGIIFIAVGLIFWTFLIMPTLSSQQNSFANIISVSYIIGDFLLFFVLLRMIYSKLDEYFVPILFLTMGILFMIITDSVYVYQTLQGTYISGGLLDIGWILSFVLVGLAAFLQANEEKIDLKRFSHLIIRIQKTNLISYMPFIWVLIAFTILVWANNNQSVSDYQLIELIVGFIIFLVIIRQFITLNENKNLLVVAENEVEFRKIAENEAHESEIYYRAIFENTGTAIIMIDQDMTISRVNSEVERLTGFSKEEIEGKKKWTDFIVEEELDRIKGYYDLRNDPNKRPREYETKGKDKEGNIKDVLVTVVNIQGNHKLLASFIDITKRKNAENLIKSSLNEKNILLREIHHRVKNNMQIISSLLNLQTRYTNDEEAVSILKESQNRVRSMAMIHQKLYQSKDLSHINFVDYIQSLVSNLFYSYNIKEAQITPVLEIENVNLNMETAVPCGLIISELISNSLKYAFPNEMKGNIHIKLKSVDDKYELIISDNGIGLPADFDFNKLESLGLLLVNNLIEQIDGKITINKSHPTQFKIIFKELKYKERI